MQFMMMIMRNNSQYLMESHKQQDTSDEYRVKKKRRNCPDSESIKFYIKIYIKKTHLN